jgi:hypothetical protein
MINVSRIALVMIASLAEFVLGMQRGRAGLALPRGVWKLLQVKRPGKSGAGAVRIDAPAMSSAAHGSLERFPIQLNRKAL